MAKFPVKQYAQLEINRAAFLKTGMIGSQLPLSAEFTAEAPCENGMWVDAERANNEYKLISDNTKHIGIVYTTEKEWGKYMEGLKTFRGVAIEGQYPRVGELSDGDTFTSNCFDMGDYADLAAIEAALKNAPLYLIPVVGSGRPQVTATMPTEGTYARIRRTFTMPNGEGAIHYSMVQA